MLSSQVAWREEKGQSFKMQIVFEIFLLLFQMKTICLFIFITIVSQITAKYFLITLDEEKGKELDDNLDIVEKDMDVEKVKKDKEADEKEVEMAKGVELKPRATHTVDDMTGRAVHGVGTDYSSSKNPAKTNWAHVTFSDSRGTRWECWYKTNKR